MSGYCPDCGNTICICSEIAECYIPLPNKQMEINELKKQIADYERVIEESCVDDCGINLLVSHRNTLESIIRATDLKAREVLAKYKSE